MTQIFPGAFNGSSRTKLPISTPTTLALGMIAAWTRSTPVAVGPTSVAALPAAPASLESLGEPGLPAPVNALFDDSPQATMAATRLVIPSVERASFAWLMQAEVSIGQAKARQL